MFFMEVLKNTMSPGGPKNFKKLKKLCSLWKLKNTIKKYSSRWTE